MAIARALLLLPWLALAAHAAAGTGPRGAAPIRVFVLAGQSNAVGYQASALALPPALYGPQHDVRFLYEEGPLAAVEFPMLRIDSGGQFVPLEYQTDPTGLTFGGVPDGYGPEIALGRVLADAHGDEVALVKFAFNGTSLDDHWGPGASGGLYGQLVALVQGALATLTAQGFDPQLEGLLWMQGEADSDNLGEALDYAGNLKTMFDALRVDLQAPGLRAVIGQLSQQLEPTTFPFMSIVRDAQVFVAHADPLVELVETSDLALNADQVHFSAASQIALGHRFASALAGAMPYGVGASPANSIALDWDGSAVLGQTFLAKSSAVPGATCLLAVALAPTAQPLLGGMLLVQPVLLVAPPLGAGVVAGAATHVLPLPADPALADLHVYLQSFALAASQPAGFALSNGLDLRLSP